MGMRRRAGVGGVGTWDWTPGWILALSAQVSWNFLAKITSTDGSRDFVLDNGDGLINTI